MDSGAYATITLMKKSGNLFGEMQIDSLSYQIKDLGQGLNALILMNTPSDGQKYCGTTNGTESIRDPQEGDFPETLCPVKAVVLYTQAAMDAHPDIAQIIELAIAETNQAFLNSNTSEATLKIVLAGTHLLTPTEWTESVNASDKDMIATDSDIQAYRAFYHADLVYVMTDDIHTDYTGAVNEFGDGPGNVVNAYAIIEAGDANTPNFVFAHETGHLFGARHEYRNEVKGNCAGSGDNSGLTHAHGFQVKFYLQHFFKTTMAICNGNGTTRLQSYSNPNVKFNGKKTGTENENFNAKVLAFASCRVSHYVEDEPTVLLPFAAITNALNRICPGQPFTVKAIVGNVPGTITYSWATSLDGVTFSAPVTTTSNTFTVNAPLSPEAIIFIKVTINNGSGIVLTEVKSFLSILEHCDHGRPIATNTVAGVDGITAYPNPASSILSIQLAGVGDNTVKFQIVDVLGKVVKEVIRSNVDSRLEKTEIDISTLNNGTYWLKCDGANFHQTIQFVCQH